MKTTKPGIVFCTEYGQMVQASAKSFPRCKRRDKVIAAQYGLDTPEGRLEKDVTS